MRKAVEAQLDPDRPPEERTRNLEKVAGKIEYWQGSRARAERSHTKARTRKLKALGLDPSRLRKCLYGKVAL